MPTPVVRETLVDQLARRIGDDIVAGRYPAGSKLPPERELARDYAVTRTSVKHTLVRLEQLGLIETRHGVGSTVRDFRATAGAAVLPLLMQGGQEGWLDEVFDARRAIGALIAREAARHRSNADVAALRERLEELTQATDATEAQRAEAEFHRTLARATVNRVFVFLVNSLLDAYLAVGPLLVAPFERRGPLVRGLGALVDAVAAADADGAAAAADRYLASTGKQMKAALDASAVTP